MIELDRVSMRYRTGDTDVQVLENLSLSVEGGERVAIVGPSGSGKTTLLLLLTGLEQPTAGEIRLADQALDSLDRDGRADLRRREIGIVFQSFHLIPTLTAEQNVALPLEIAGERGAREAARDMLARVGLGERGRHLPSELSGGEQQRVAVARALVHSPRIVVADEPTGNLDGRTGDTIMELLLALNREQGSTLLLVTHDLELAAACDRTLRLQDGSLHALDKTETAAA